MLEELNFYADAAIITRLGRELVAKQETALIELIKNSYDADATMVRVVFDDSPSGRVLEIVDDGEGMTRDDLVSGFLRLASDLKVQAPRSKLYERQRAGRKGIGRFATQRLGDRLILSTTKEGANYGHVLEVDWTRFTAGVALDKVAVELRTEERTESAKGTRVRIESLCDEWSESQIRRCWRGVLALQQPFPVAPVLSKESGHRDPGFVVEFVKERDLFGDETVVANLQTEILDHLHAVIEFRVDDSGLAQWRISKNAFDEPTEWEYINHNSPESKSAVPYSSLKNAWMKAFYVILDTSLLPSLVYSRVRDELGQYGGVRLYRNGFRVVPYGEPDNDWLQLDELYAKRSYLFPIANRNFFGVVDVRDVDGELFEEHTSREGLIENQALTELKGLASSVLISAGLKIARARGKKPKAGKPVIKTEPAEKLAHVERAIKAAQSIVERTVHEAPAPALVEIAKETAVAAEGLQAVRDELAAVKAEMADESAMLRFLATLGMTTAEFSHETGMTFDAFRLDFKKVFEVALESSADEAFQAQAARAESMLNRLDTLTSYLNSLAAARSARGMAPLSLSKAVEDFAKGVLLQAKSINIELVVKVPSYDGLFTAPMHEAEMASVLLNFYTNAVKALKRSENERKILVEALRAEDERSLVLRFSDSGDGIAPINRQRVFDAFFTTRAAPVGGALDIAHAKGTGLGLWIVRQIVENAGGTIEVVDAPSDYSTCIEMTMPGEGYE